MDSCEDTSIKIALCASSVLNLIFGLFFLLKFVQKRKNKQNEKVEYDYYAQSQGRRKRNEIEEVDENNIEVCQIIRLERISFQ